MLYGENSAAFVEQFDINKDEDEVHFVVKCKHYKEIPERSF